MAEGDRRPPERDLQLHSGRCQGHDGTEIWKDHQRDLCGWNHRDYRTDQLQCSKSGDHRHDKISCQGTRKIWNQRECRGTGSHHEDDGKDLY